MPELAPQVLINKSRADVSGGMMYRQSEEDEGNPNYIFLAGECDDVIKTIV